MELKNFFKNVIALVRRYGNRWEIETWCETDDECGNTIWYKGNRPMCSLLIYDDSNLEWNLDFDLTKNKINVWTLDQRGDNSSVFSYTTSFCPNDKKEFNKTYDVGLFLKFQKLIKEQMGNGKFTIE